MGEWFTKVFQALHHPAQQAVRAALQQAQLARTKLALEVTSRNRTVVLTSTVEQVREDDFVISQPTVGGTTHPLTFEEVINLGFVLPSGYHRAECKCLGRIKIPAGNSPAAQASNSSVLYAYRLSLPESLLTEDRRNAPRSQLSLSQPVDAQLYAAASLDGPVLGRILDISMTGARLLVSAPNRKMEPGQIVYLKAMLPEPAGQMDDLVKLARVECDARTGKCTIGVQFQQPIEGLETLMRSSTRAA